ncbi:MAG TPA: phenylalanine--tRNA ligase subunit beta [Desulfobulbus sp.]|nr:phenylalanine--tRNA ligase subunit beta [Desulfobulbus sp.]
MKFTLSWLSTFVSIDGLDPDQLADRLTMLGLEVEAVEKLYQGLDAILTARVVSVRPHPDADRLTLCDVDTGQETVQVVCGAPNVRAGLVTAIALPGVSLPGGMKIRKARVRGEQSLGMLCSARELGLGDDHSGIIELDPDLAPGRPLTEALGLDDTMIEIDLTPNRPDCASVIGIAREVAGFTGSPLRQPVTEVPVLTGEDVDFKVTIAEPGLCPRYAARRLSNVRVGPSPWWLQRQLLAVGMRPINNIVDVTNFVMLEYGQPLHAFDFTRLEGGEIVVRLPQPDEKRFTTLDGVEREIEPDMLMICDARRPVAVAGVMGGLDSEVTDTTTEILLESACFDPVSIRRTARRLNLPSEASYRFERGVDPELATRAMERAVQLMADVAGAEIRPSGIDEYPGRKEPLRLDLRVGRVNALLGVELDSGRVASYLRSIGFEVADDSQDVLSVTVPSFRIDIEREVDLVEEIARLVGYNEIPVTSPRISMEYPRHDELRTLRRQAAEILTAQGFYEAINYSFTAERHHDLMGLAADDPRRSVTRLLNPLTEDQAVMRTMLLPGLLENIRRNINFQRPDIRLFEIGKIFLQKKEGEQPEERFQVCAVMSGGRYPGARPLYFAGRETDFFDIKGAAECLLEALRIRRGEGGVDFVVDRERAQPYSDPELALQIVARGQEIGRVGRLNTRAAKGFSLKQEVYFFELDLEDLIALPRQAREFKPLPRYPSVRRDIALVVPDQVPAGDLLQATLDQKERFVESVDIFDVYRGKPIADGMKSVALTVTYRSPEQTLDDETVDRIHQKIVNSLMATFGARYREGME